MKEIEERLHEDAARLEAEVPAELRARIDSALRRAAPAVPRRTRAGVGLPRIRHRFAGKVGQQAKARAIGDRYGPGSLWLGGSLTGLAAAASVVLLVNRDAGQAPEPLSHTPRPVSEYVQLEFPVPLRAQTAVLTEPLEEELANLRSDLEKARENVARDLEFTL